MWSRSIVDFMFSFAYQQRMAVWFLSLLSKVDTNPKNDSILLNGFSLFGCTEIYPRPSY